MTGTADHAAGPPPGVITDSQATCLRLVAQGMSSKEIAAATGLSWQTVDTYLKQAMARLGATNRRDAARAFAALEQSRQSGSPSQDLGGTAVAAEGGASDDGARDRETMRLPPLGGSINDLRWDQKTLRALQVAAVAAAVLIALALAMAGLLRTFT